MNESMGNVSMGWVVFIILILWVFLGRGFGGFGSNYGYDPTPNCDVERRNLISVADTNYRIIEQANATRQVVEATASATQEKIDFYAYQDLRDKLSESQMKIAELTNQLFVKDQLAPITASISDIRCNMLVRPNVTGVGVSCPSQAILNGLGINGYNGYSCGCNGSVLV